MKVRIVSGHYMCHPETCTCNAYRVEYFKEEKFYDGWFNLGISSDDYNYILYLLQRDYPNAQIEK